MIDNLAQSIRYLRRARKVTQRALAKAIGVSANYLTMLEHGHRHPSLKVLSAIADTLDIPLTLFFVPQPPPDTTSYDEARIVEELRSIVLEYHVCAPLFKQENPPC